MRRLESRDGLMHVVRFAAECTGRANLHTFPQGVPTLKVT